MTPADFWIHDVMEEYWKTFQKTSSFADDVCKTMSLCLDSGLDDFLDRLEWTKFPNQPVSNGVLRTEIKDALLRIIKNGVRLLKLNKKYVDKLGDKDHDRYMLWEDPVGGRYAVGPTAWYVLEVGKYSWLLHGSYCDEYYKKVTGLYKD